MNGSGTAIDSRYVSSLGTQFTAFVNLLLEAERSHQRLPIDALEVTLNENTADGGVDATLRDAVGSEAVQLGTSAWQFKRSRLSENKCVEEYEGASFAQEIVGDGGSYCLAMGADLNSQEVTDRKEALGRKIGDATRVKVFNASMLATWANRFPAVLRALGVPLSVFDTHSSWAARQVHTAGWTPDTERVDLALEITNHVLSQTGRAVRIEGPAGFGKTRLVLEALRDPMLAPRVLYADQASEIDHGLVMSLIQANASAILVIDECDRRMDRLFRERLHSDSSIRLITIGHAEELSVFDDGLHVLGAIGDHALRLLLSNEFSAIDEAFRALIVDSSEGNIREALQLAQYIQRNPSADAFTLVESSGPAGVAREVLENRPFEVLRSLSLLRRVGWENGVESQKQALAGFLGLPAGELDAALGELEEYSYIGRQGRYVYVTPQTVALALAAEMWEERPTEIMNELLLKLDSDGAEMLFARAADLGRYPAAQNALGNILKADGPLGSITAIDRYGAGAFLKYLAVIDPANTASRIHSVVDSASDSELKQAAGIRRSLVWALEKLAWHSETFAISADCLLRLGLNENESWSNNASGVWEALFGARLPATAASPSARLEYLEAKAEDDDPEIRSRVVTAAESVVNTQEYRMISAELQQGSATAAPGATRTAGEDLQYRRGGLRILSDLVQDEDETVAAKATEKLSALGLQLSGTGLWSDYMSAIERLSGEQVVWLRREAQRWLGIVERSEDEARQQRIRSLIEELAVEDAVEQLKDLGAAPPWSRDNDDVVAAAQSLLEDIASQGELDRVWSWLQDDQVPSCYNLGRALARFGANPDTEAKLIERSELNLGALGGYLDEVEKNNAGHRDELLDSEQARSLGHETRARLSMPSEPTARSLARLEEMVLSGDLPATFAGVLGLGRYSHNFSDEQFVRMLEAWVEVISTAEEIAALTDLLGLHIHRQHAIADLLKPVSWEIVEKRTEQPSIGAAQWEWSQIAKILVQDDPARIARLVLDIVASGFVMLPTDEEASRLAEAAALDPRRVWPELAARLEGGDFRIAMSVRGWLLNAVPVDLVKNWVGESEDRASLAAEVCPIGSDDPGELGRWLLSHFPENENVKSGLAMRFLEGSWTGPRSQHLAAQIAALQSWDAGAPEISTWIQGLIEHLQRDMAMAVRDEEERGF